MIQDQLGFTGITQSQLSRRIRGFFKITNIHQYRYSAARWTEVQEEEEA